MKKVTMLMCCLGILLFTLNTVEAGPVKLKVYGKGGIVQTPDGYTKVCPNMSQYTCADVTIEDSGSASLTGAMATMNYDGRIFEVEIVEVEVIKIDEHTYNGHGLVVKGSIE